MSYHAIDMSAYKRRQHFDYFRSLANPYVGVTVNVDITDFLPGIKAKGYPFFMSFYYCAMQAANSVPEFRQRIRDGGIIEYDWCNGSHTVALDDDTYCYCLLDSNLPFPQFLPKALAAQAEAKERRSLDDAGDADSLIFVTCSPLICHTALTMPVPCPADSNPRLDWGKRFTLEGRTLIPFTLQCNHALMDALHLSRFYAALDRELKELVKP